MNAAKQLALAAEALYACGFRGRARRLRGVADELALTEAAFDGIHAQLAAVAAERDALAAKVERLEGELFDAGYRQAEDRAELDALRTTVERVRALHRPYAPLRGGNAQFCSECEGDELVPYPCPTARALDGTESMGEAGTEAAAPDGVGSDAVRPRHRLRPARA